MAASRGEYEYKNEYKDGRAEDKESEFAIPVPPIPDRFEEIEAMTLDQVNGGSTYDALIYELTSPYDP